MRDSKRFVSLICSVSILVICSGCLFTRAFVNEYNDGVRIHTIKAQLAGNDQEMAMRLGINVGDAMSMRRGWIAAMKKDKGAAAAAFAKDVLLMGATYAVYDNNRGSSSGIDGGSTIESDGKSVTINLRDINAPIYIQQTVVDRSAGSASHGDEARQGQSHDLESDNQ